MDKEFLTHIIEEVIDFALPIISLLFASVWLVQSIYIIVSTDIFAVVRLFPLNIAMHATSALSVSLIYIINYFFFRTFLPGHLRVVRAMLFTVVGAIFYDLVWSISNIVINDYGSFLLPLVSFTIVLSYIIIFDKKNFKILDVDLVKILFVTVIYGVTFTLFIFSGFFQQFALYELGLATDPHGWVWLLHKTVTLWIWTIFALR